MEDRIVAAFVYAKIAGKTVTKMIRSPLRMAAHLALWLAGGFFFVLGLALYDNANSLHTNAYDEAVTTPSQESVRRALAIQLVINKEFGLSKNENPNQGSFVVEELTDLVEAAVLAEFRSISDRGGVLGAIAAQAARPAPSLRP